VVNGKKIVIYSTIKPGNSSFGCISKILNLSTGFAFVFLMILPAAFTAWRNKYLQNKKEIIKDVNYNEQYL
jgi:hypothetical protein